jgi:hypothetical protein
MKIPWKWEIMVLYYYVYIKKNSNENNTKETGRWIILLLIIFPPASLARVNEHARKDDVGGRWVAVAVLLAARLG